MLNSLVYFLENVRNLQVHSQIYEAVYIPRPFTLIPSKLVSPTRFLSILRHSMDLMLIGFTYKYYVIFSDYNQQDATFLKFIYFCKTLYMFQTVFPSIIRSTKLHIQRQVFVRPLLLPAASSW